MIDRLLSLFSYDVGIDLGPVNACLSPFQYYPYTAQGAHFAGRAVLEGMAYA